MGPKKGKKRDSSSKSRSRSRQGGSSDFSDEDVENLIPSFKLRRPQSGKKIPKTREIPETSDVSLKRGRPARSKKKFSDEIEILKVIESPKSDPDKKNSSRNLTVKRREMIESFRKVYDQNPFKYGVPGSLSMMSALVKHFNKKDPQEITLENVEHWLEKNPHIRRGFASYIPEGEFGEGVFENDTRLFRKTRRNNPYGDVLDQDTSPEREPSRGRKRKSEIAPKVIIKQEIESDIEEFDGFISKASFKEYPSDIDEFQQSALENFSKTKARKPMPAFKRKVSKSKPLQVKIEKDLSLQESKRMSMNISDMPSSRWEEDDDWSLSAQRNGEMPSCSQPTKKFKQDPVLDIKRIVDTQSSGSVDEAYGSVSNTNESVVLPPFKNLSQQDIHRFHHDHPSQNHPPSSLDRLLRSTPNHFEAHQLPGAFPPAHFDVYNIEHLISKLRFECSKNKKYNHMMPAVDILDSTYQNPNNYYQYGSNLISEMRRHFCAIHDYNHMMPAVDILDSTYQNPNNYYQYGANLINEMRRHFCAIHDYNHLIPVVDLLVFLFQSKEYKNYFTTLTS